MQGSSEVFSTWLQINMNVLEVLLISPPRKASFIFSRTPHSFS